MTPDTIILHCSATEDGKTVSWSAIRNYHTSWKLEGVIIRPDEVDGLSRAGMPVECPWSDIGYHFGIERINDTYEILVGRMPNVSGAHCRDGGMNRRSLGICFVGDFDDVAPGRDQWRLGLKLVGALMDIFKIAPARVFGHREFAPWKTCPGKRFDLDLFRNQLSSKE